MVEVDYVFRTLDSALAKGVREHKISELMDLAVGSVINQMLFGYRFSDVSAVTVNIEIVTGVFRAERRNSWS